MGCVRHDMIDKGVTEAMATNGGERKKAYCIDLK